MILSIYWKELKCRLWDNHSYKYAHVLTSPLFPKNPQVMITCKWSKALVFCSKLEQKKCFSWFKSHGKIGIPTSFSLRLCEISLIYSFLRASLPGNKYIYLWFNAISPLGCLSNAFNYKGFRWSHPSMLVRPHSNCGGQYVVIWLALKDVERTFAMHKAMSISHKDVHLGLTILIKEAVQNLETFPWFFLTVGKQFECGWKRVL